MIASHRTTTTTALLDGLHDPANEEVWREFDTRYRPIILGFAVKLGLSDEDAADVAQDTLARFVQEYRAGRYDRTRGRLVTGRDILPNKTYIVQGIAQGGNINDEVHYSTPPTPVPTREKYGDLVANFGGSGQPNFADITACVNRFIGLPTAPSVPEADVAPETPNKNVNFEDISKIVDSFRGLPYPYGPPVQCE